MPMDAAAAVAPAPRAVPQLPPGFRFHPTDEELVLQYLRRHVAGFALPADIIPTVDLLRFDPWDLLEKSGEEKYFFNQREAKYTNGSRSNRATAKGYWKATGKEKQVLSPRSHQLVGMKRVLVFYQGKPPHGARTDWVMHEYRLAGVLSGASNASMTNKGNVAAGEGWVLCRIFKKRRGRNGDDDMDAEEGEVNNSTSNNNSGNGGGNAVTYIDLFGHRVPVHHRAPFSPDSSCITEASDEPSREETSRSG